MNPVKYLSDKVGEHSKGYKMLIVKTYSVVLKNVLTDGFPYLMKGLYYAARGKKNEQFRAFTHGSMTWGRTVIKNTKTTIYKSNEITIPETGHMIYLNHVNELDFPFDCCIVNKPFLANQTIKSTYLAYWWMKAMGSQVFDTSHQRTIAVSVRNLMAGLKDYSYIVYPEGQNTYSEEIKPLKKGMVKLAFENKIPVAVVLKSGVRRLQEKQSGNVIGYRMAGIINPEQFKTWEEFRDYVHDRMVEEKNILDKEVEEKNAQNS